jgi:hypothetical protein
MNDHSRINTEACTLYRQLKICTSTTGTGCDYDLQHYEGVLFICCPLLQINQDHMLTRSSLSFQGQEHNILGAKRKKIVPSVHACMASGDDKTLPVAKWTDW